MNPEQLRTRILAADLAWIPVALAAEQALCSRPYCWQLPLEPTNFIIYVVCTVFAWVWLSEEMHLDGFRGGWRLSALVSHLLVAAVLLMALLLAVEHVSGRYVGRLTLSVFLVFLLFGFVGIRGFALRTVRRRHQSGAVSRVIIVGSDSLASELAEKFNHHPELLCKVIGFLSPEGEPPGLISTFAAGPASVSTIDLIGLLRQHQVDELVLAHTPASSEILNLVALCRQQAIGVSLVPQPYELYLSRPSLMDLGGVPLLRLGEVGAGASARIGKRILDLGLGLVLATISLPLILICGAALFFAGRQAFRWERRIGWRGGQFSMPRLNVDRDPQDGSRFDRLLWRFSISELPQLWNVLRGEMSLVGPRPEGPERANRYSAWQQQRLSVKPGMTGLAQVHGLREQHSSEDKTRYDLQYMLHPSLLKDVSLLLETVWTLSLRLFKPLNRAADSSREGASAAQAVSRSRGSHSFPEMLQHAHRTQSGSD